MIELIAARAKAHNDRASGLQRNFLLIGASAGWLAGGTNGIAWGVLMFAIGLTILDSIP